MIGIGFIGCGRHGERYLRHLERGDVPGLRPVALWRRDGEAARRLADRYEVEPVRNAADLVAREDVDGVIVVTPPGRHDEEVLLALDAGKPVLVEKPVTATAEQGRALAARVGADAARVMVAQTLRYNRTLQELRRRWADIGPVHRLRIQQRLEPSPIAWQRDREMAGGGSVVLTGVHLFDAIRWLVGRTPDAVQCRALAVEDRRLENVFDACFEWQAERILAATEVSKFSSSRSGQLEVVGTRGQLVADYAAGRLLHVVGRDTCEVAAPGDAPTLPPCLEDFAKLVRGEIESPIPLADGVETLRMAEACYRSDETGRRVRLVEVP